LAIALLILQTYARLKVGSTPVNKYFGCRFTGCRNPPARERAVEAQKVSVPPWNCGPTSAPHCDAFMRLGGPGPQTVANGFQVGADSATAGDEHRSQSADPRKTSVVCVIVPPAGTSMNGFRIFFSSRGVVVTVKINRLGHRSRSCRGQQILLRAGGQIAARPAVSSDGNPVPS